MRDGVAGAFAGAILRPLVRVIGAALLLLVPVAATARPGGALVPARVGAVGGHPAALYVAEGAPFRTLLIAVRAGEAGAPAAAAPAGAWSTALPRWESRARHVRDLGLWEYVVTEEIAEADVGGTGEIEALLRGAMALPGAGAAPPAVLLVETSPTDAAVLALAGAWESAAFHVEARFRHAGGSTHRLPGLRVRVDAAGAPDRPLEVRVDGPAYGTVESAAFLLLAARIAQDLEGGFRATLRVAPGAMQLIVLKPGLAPAEATRLRADAAALAAWGEEAARAVRRAAGSTPSQRVLDALRDRVLLQRALSFEAPGARVDFVARRLTLAPPESVFAEETLVHLVTPALWRAVAQEYLARPAGEVVVRPGASDIASAAPAGPRVTIENRRHYRYLHESSNADVVCVYLMVALPGGEGGTWTHPARTWWGGWTEVTEPAPLVTREEAALLWRALVGAALRRDPETGARIAVALPSPLPTHGPDPYASNQFSGVMLQAERRHEAELLDFAATILSLGPPAADAHREAVQALGEALTPRVVADYLREVAEQAALLAGSGAGAVFARRRGAMRALAEDWEVVERAGDAAAIPEEMHFSRAAAVRAYHAFFNPANLTIAVSMPGEAEPVAQYLDRRIAREEWGAWRGHDVAQAVAPWPDPAAMAPFPPAGWEGAAVVVPGGAAHHAAALALATWLTEHRRGRGDAAWSFDVLEIGASVVLLVTPTNIARTQAVARPARQLARELRAAGLDDRALLGAAIAQSREATRRGRALREASSAQRLFQRARNAFLHGDAAYREKLDAMLDSALGGPDADLVAGLATRLLEALEGRTAAASDP